jgi:hypothetical protein
MMISFVFVVLWFCFWFCFCFCFSFLFVGSVCLDLCVTFGKNGVAGFGLGSDLSSGTCFGLGSDLSLGIGFGFGSDCAGTRNLKRVHSG